MIVFGDSDEDSAPPRPSSEPDVSVGRVTRRRQLPALLLTAVVASSLWAFADTSLSAAQAIAGGLGLLAAAAGARRIAAGHAARRRRRRALPSMTQTASKVD